MPNLPAILDAIDGLTDIDLAELLGRLARRFHVIVLPGRPAGKEPPPEEAAPELALYRVVLRDAGLSRVPVIKAVREAAGLGLMEAKRLVDGAPCAVAADLDEAAAAEIADTLRKVGAAVEVEVQT